MKYLLRYLLFILPVYVFGNNNDPEFGIIKGQISTSDNKAAASVNVVVKGTNRSAITDEDGHFTIAKVPAGSYQLEVSLIGYETLRQDIVVEKNKVTAVALQLNLSNTQLQEVIVTTAKNKFANKSSDQIARLPLSNLENPQVYNVVGNQLMREQVVVERTDLYRNIPGAVPNFAAGGSQGFSMRGFQNSMGTRNGLTTSAIVPMNPIILERVEAIKGPVGTLFGNSRNVTFGGAYNYVTKRPYDHFGGEISFSAGSFEFGRITADINTPLNEDKTLLLRVDAAAQSEGSFQDQGFARNYTFAPVITYQASDRLTFTLDLELTRSNYTTTSLLLGNMNNFTARSMKDLKLGYRQSLINNEIDVTNGLNNIQAMADYKISDQWKSQTNFLYSDGYYKNLYWSQYTLLTDSTASRVLRNQTPETFGNIEFQQNFVGDFLIGSLRNRMVIGLDYTYNYNELYRSVGLIYDTVDFTRNYNKGMTIERVDELSNQKGFAATTADFSTYSAYVSDVLNITPSLMAMLSLRVDHFTTDGTFTVNTGKYTGDYDQTALSPKFGLVYELVKHKLSLFGNYMNGFVNLAPVTQPDNTILVLDPQYGNQWEGGVKFDLFSNKLSGSLSYYDIAVTNSTRVENNITYQDGTQHSKGLEAELIANPVNGLNIVAGYAYNDNKYKNASPALKGKYLSFSPEHVANIWASYFVAKGKLKGWGIGAGGNYVSDSWFESSNQFRLPAYTLLSAALYFDQPAFRISLKGNNLLDEEYWNTTGMPQKPFNFVTSVAFKL